MQSASVVEGIAAILDFAAQNRLFDIVDGQFEFLSPICASYGPFPCCRGVVAVVMCMRKRAWRGNHASHARMRRPSAHVFVVTLSQLHWWRCGRRRAQAWTFALTPQRGWRRASWHRPLQPLRRAREGTL